MLLQGVSGITDLITTPGPDQPRLRRREVGDGQRRLGADGHRLGPRRGPLGRRRRDGGLQPAARGVSIDGAHGVLLSIAGGSDLGLFEINEAAALVAQAAHPEANIIFGATIDDALGDEVRVTVIAAGFDGGMPKRRDEGTVLAPRRRAAADPGGDPAPRPQALRRASEQAAAGSRTRRQPAPAPSPSRRPRQPRAAEPRAARSRADAVRRRRPRRARLPEVGDVLVLRPHRRTAPSTWPSPTGTAGSVPSPFDSLNLALEGGDDPEAPRREPAGSLLADFAPGDRPGRPAPGARRRRRTSVDGPAHDAADAARRRRRSSPTEPGVVLMVRAADCVPVLLADPDAGVDRRRPLRAARAWPPGSCRRTVDADARARRAPTSPPGSGRTCAARCYEVPAGDAGRGRRRRAGQPSPPPRGARRRSTSAPASAPSSSAPASTVVDVSRAPASRPTSTPTAATARAAGRLAGLIRIARMSDRDRRDEIAAEPRRRTRAGSPTACADAGRDPDEVTLVVVDQVLPGLRRPAPRRPRRHRRRGEPPPGGRGQGRRVRRPRPALALHRRPAEQQGGRRGVVRRRRRVGRPAPSSSAALNRGAHERSPPGRRAAPGQPRPARAREGRAGRRPRRPGRPGRARSRRPACCGCAG